MPTAFWDTRGLEKLPSKILPGALHSTAERLFEKTSAFRALDTCAKQRDFIKLLLA